MSTPVDSTPRRFAFFGDPARELALLAIVQAAQNYLEARDELTQSDDAHRELVEAYELNPGDLDSVEQALTRAEEREALALANLRAKVAAW